MSRRKSVYIPKEDEEAWQEFQAAARKNGTGIGSFACMCFNKLQELCPEGVVFHPSIFEEFAKMEGVKELAEAVLKK